MPVNEDDATSYWSQINRKLNKKPTEATAHKKVDDWADSIVQTVWRPVTVGLIIGGPTLYILRKYIIGKRFKTAAHIPIEYLEKQCKIRGRVVSVGDSDNFRLYHTPGLGWNGFWALRKIPQTRKELRNQTISVRIAGVDAPEGAHFGMPAQPFSTEALQFLKKLVLNRTVEVQLLSRDQYQRVVAMAFVRRPPFFLKKNVSVEMVKAGLASIYEAKGAQYAGQFEQLQKYEAYAKSKKKGIWSLKKKYISPSEHKARYLNGSR
ncbi:hypothetical protein BDF20DRAFT_915114 [Mycotypha africana]|uniref:uncharacterized protein n=1 Tax=Mycotypha africana TaxID=64632 RepID=UPI0023017774|nr:uncharacterized protein BDF20DRAFT_915114 [Mycotypha africana]KAI8973707.1 hypothetical protein BDF20DRAFT_915114 [Mycotypha africana]